MGVELRGKKETTLQQSSNGENLMDKSYAKAIAQAYNIRNAIEREKKVCRPICELVTP